MLKERIAILDGFRTPMGKAGGMLGDIQADDLCVYPIKAVFGATGIKPEEIDEVIIGNVAQPSHAANIARVIALKAGVPQNVPAFTVHRNCASGMQSITNGAESLLLGKSSIILAGGTESMSNIPFLFSKEYKEFMTRLARARSVWQRLKVLAGFRLSMVKPEIGLKQGLTDPVSGMIMGDTAENLAREFHIDRKAQDEYALLSHERALAAMDDGIFDTEVVPVNVKGTMITTDEGPRRGQSLEKLAKLKPYFDRHNGTVTVGNSCPVTDGAAAVILMRESDAKKRGFKPIGFLKDYTYAGLEPERMGLGPVYSTARLFKQTGVSLADIELIEMNEAFASQIIANEQAFSSEEFAKKHLNQDKPLGTIDRSIMNVQGGAIALGHPVGMTGTRMVVHLLKELNRQGKKTGLATLCVGGGQGAALLLESE